MAIVDSAESVRYIIYRLSHGAMVGKSWASCGSSIGRSDCVAPFYNTHFLHFDLCMCSVSAVCAVCVLCVCVCVEITVLTKATVSGSVGPVYRRDFLAPRSARCSEPYVPSKLLLRLFWAVGSGGGGEGVGGQQQQ